MQNASKLDLLGKSLLRQLERGQTREAVETTARLGKYSRQALRRGPDPKRIRKGFVELLRRRGYYVDNPEQLKASLAEIRALGRGFDLYDLALGLRRLERAITRTQEKRDARSA